jgi:hypothetical protein
LLGGDRVGDTIFNRAPIRVLAKYHAVWVELDFVVDLARTVAQHAVEARRLSEVSSIAVRIARPVGAVLILILGFSISAYFLLMGKQSHPWSAMGLACLTLAGTSLYIRAFLPVFFDKAAMEVRAWLSMPEEAGELQLSLWSVKKTEAEWIQATDDFGIRFAPKWFELLKWVFIIAALHFAAMKTRSTFVSLLETLSNGALFLYLQAVLYDIPFYRLLPRPLIRTHEFARVFSFLTAGLLLWLLWRTLPRIIQQLAEK